MIEKCYDEGTLQAFLDNELAPELSQAVARHLADCDPCAILLAEVEEETALVFSALGEEFNTLVPTQRLWTKINQSIESECRRRSPWQSLLAFFSGFNVLSPQFAAFASLVFIVTVVAALMTIKPGNEIPTVVDKANTPQTPTIDKSAPPKVEVATHSDSIDDDSRKDEKVIEVDKTADKAPQQYQIVKAAFKPETKASIKNQPYRNAEVVTLQYLPGEETFVSTIARLEGTVNEQKDEVLKPSARFSYEKNMAVVNDAIRKMKAEVKKNPKNKAARQVLFASYQNKIDLLNSVSERSELMASLR